MVYNIVDNLLDDKEVPDDAKAKGRWALNREALG
jgi:hypothetical protein